MIIYLPLAVAIVGAFFAIASANPKVAELGKWAFVIGLFVFLYGAHPVLTVVR